MVTNQANLYQLLELLPHFYLQHSNSHPQTIKSLLDQPINLELEPEICMDGVLSLHNTQS